MDRHNFLKHTLRGFTITMLGKGYYNSTAAQIELVRVQVKINQLPAPLQGLKIGLLTDFHSSFIVPKDLIETAADLVMSERPDLIVLTGDFISGATKFLSGSIGEFKQPYLERCAVALSRLKKGISRDSIKILLSHNPDINEEISLAKERIDLVLSGHTYGGQVVVPVLGQPVIPSKFAQKYRKGMVRDGERQTYVSRGVGCLLAPVRLNCMPEATVLTLT